MVNNLISLKEVGGKSVGAEPNPLIVEYAEEILELAKSGEIQALQCFFSRNPLNHPGQYSVVPSEHHNAIFTALHLGADRMSQQMIAEAE